MQPTEHLRFRIGLPDVDVQSVLLVGEVAAQPVDALMVDDVERGRFLAGVQAAEAGREEHSRRPGLDRA